MSKSFILYVINTVSGTTRDVVVNTKTARQARNIAESMILRNNEMILTVYPKELS